MITIKDFCEKHEIERRREKYGDYSDLYVAIFIRYESEVKSWYAIEADGSSCKHMLRYYEEGDLKEYFEEAYKFKFRIPNGALPVSGIKGVK